MKTRQQLVVVAALIATSLAAGCAGKPVDPLAADRKRLLVLEDEPLPEGWASEATVFVGEGLLASQLQAALDDASAEVARHPGFDTPLGVATVRPAARVSEVKVAPSSLCEACVEVTVAVDGMLQGSIAGPLGAMARELPFTASATSTLELAFVDVEEKRRVLLRPVRNGQWAAAAEVMGLPPALNVALSDILRAQVEQLITSGLVPELPLLDVPREGPVRVRGVRARTVPLTDGEHVVAVDLAFVALERGRVQAPLPAGDGFVVVIPFETLRGLARAAALRMAPRDGHVAEPLSVTIDGDRFTVDVRVWKIAPEPVARDFRAEGRIVIEDGVLKVASERVTPLGDAPLLDPLELLVRAAIGAGLEDGLQAIVPARQEEDLFLGRKLAVEVTSVEGAAGALLVRGRVTLVKPGDV